MKIIVCLDYSSFTNKLLSDVKSFVDNVTSKEIAVLHIVDEPLYYPTTCYEVQLSDSLQSESKQLKSLCTEYLGADIDFIEEFGIPKLKIDEVLSQMNYD